MRWLSVAIAGFVQASRKTKVLLACGARTYSQIERQLPLIFGLENSISTGSAEKNVISTATPALSERDLLSWTHRNRQGRAVPGINQSILLTRDQHRQDQSTEEYSRVFVGIIAGEELTYLFG
jgi:hypothetical protein